MITFFACLVLLLVGFFTYGKLVEKVFRIDDRPTPAVAHPDGVDFVPMKTWRIFLIQLLNIAGPSMVRWPVPAGGPWSTCGLCSEPSWVAASMTFCRV